MQEGYVPPQKKKRSKAKSAGQSSHDDRSNGLSINTCFKTIRGDENRLENNQVKVRNASMIFQT